MSIEGTGAWKTLTICNSQTGEIVEEKKFYKNDFKDVWNSPQYKPYVDKIFNAAHADLMGNQDAVDINSESFEEVRAVAMMIDEDSIDAK